MLAKKSVLAINALLHTLAALTATSVLWLYIVTFNNDKNHHQSEFCANLMYHDFDPG